MDAFNNQAASDAADPQVQRAAEVNDPATAAPAAAVAGACATDASTYETDPEAQVAQEADAAVDAAERLIAAEQALAAYKDKYMRLQAEWDNFRKRTESELSDNKIRATENVMKDILPVLDDFERAIAHASVNGSEGLLEGVVAIGNKLNAALAKHGLKVIDPAGEPFDALEHQAVATVPDETVPDETVNQVYQKGYRLGSKVLRSAMVTLSVGGPKRSTEE
ncbi:MAG: nucleotide exchange factor GrpE [Eggerthellales bacterium]|nr:nucleotide exchange factor GrpE [Eggerthellales bacterium]